MVSASPDIETINTLTTVVASVKPKLIARPFNSKKPALWFAQLETQFADIGVITEIDKYNKTVPLIDTFYAAEVEDLIICRPREHWRPHSVKTSQTLEKSRSKYRRWDPQNGWLSHLPEQTRATLTTQENTTVEDLAKLAARMPEVFHLNSVAAITTSTDNASNKALFEPLDQLMASVPAIPMHGSHSRPRERSENSRGQRSNSRRRSSSRKLSKKSDTWWYHIEYGNNARDCQPGCKIQHVDLAPEKLKIAQAEFSSTLKLGTASRSENPWSSALHLASKSNNG
ncbi:uncharacterized protein LOC107039052 [Diachasma alloeum]|uniref:uncharacterized protein LOC107039052 n=1 Tax=Diachasma alloeum TaxID=454923 RepID=UPI00073837AF|nr:uncharacterized protein LOC107039052 [Diachasma alloeum]